MLLRRASRPFLYNLGGTLRPSSLTAPTTRGGRRKGLRFLSSDGIPPDGPDGEPCVEPPPNATDMTLVSPDLLSASSSSSSTSLANGRRRRMPPNWREPWEDFGELPNILETRPMELDYLSLADNSIELLPLSSPSTKNSTPTKDFDYAWDIELTREWINIAGGTLLYASHRQGHIPGSSSTLGSLGRRRKVSGEPLVNQGVILSYSGHGGELMLRRIAIGLARSLGADFLGLQGDEFTRALLYLKQESSYLPTRKSNMETALALIENRNEVDDCMREHWDRKALTEFLRWKLPQLEEYSSIKLGHQFKILGSPRPIVTGLEYLVHCLRTGEGAAPRRVLFVAANTELLGFSEQQTDLIKFLESRFFLDSNTLLIMAEKCPSDVTMALPERKSSTGAGVVEDTPLLNKEAGRKIRVETSKGIFDFVLDNRLRLPRLLVTPPRDPQATIQHRRQISDDVCAANFATNYAAILKTFSTIIPSESPYAYFLQSLPHPGDAMQTLLARVKPLTTRTLAPNEITALCLSIPLAREALSHPVESFVKGVATFFANRHAQLSTIPDLAQTVSYLNSSSQSSTQSNSGGKLDLDIESLNKYEKRLLPCLVTPAMVNVRYEDIGALDNIKELLYELISLRLERPEFFARGILKDSVSGILLFGPPGTGKTMLAKAVAAQSGANFLAVNSSSIFDMYVGEGEKNTKALFTLARKLAPCIIFIDEVDALLDSRQYSLGRASRVEIINEFMSEWDGLLSRNTGVTVMAATNRPFVLDDAVLRRLPRRVMVDLPDVEARESILRLLFKEDLLSSEVDLVALAHRSDLYSGSDLKNVAMAAAMRALRRHRNNPAIEMTITEQDLESALKDIPASVSEHMVLLMEIREWNRQYGEGQGLFKDKNRFGF